MPVSRREFLTVATGSAALLALGVSASRTSPAAIAPTKISAELSGLFNQFREASAATDTYAANATWELSTDDLWDQVADARHEAKLAVLSHQCQTADDHNAKDEWLRTTFWEGVDDFGPEEVSALWTLQVLNELGVLSLTG